MCHPCAIMWEADMPPAIGRIAAALSLASLDQGLLGHSIWYEVCICLGLSKFYFSYRNIVGTGGLSGRAIMQPWDGCSIGYASSHSHSHFTSAWFASSPLPPPSHLPIPHRQVWQCFTHIKHLRHQHITSAWFASSPLPLPSHLPIPHCQVW